jgi:hypothetical protein
MSFRHTRRSRDGYAWLGLVLSFLGVIAFGIATFHQEPAFPRILTAVLSALALVAAVWFVKGILSPFELEVVVDGGEIRWGRVDRPDRQERVAVGKLVCLIYDKSDGRDVLGDIGHWRLLHIDDGILMRSEERDALVDHLRQTFPQLKIEIR